jgi:hypothetical protein
MLRRKSAIYSHQNAQLSSSRDEGDYCACLKHAYAIVPEKNALVLPREERKPYD